MRLGTKTNDEFMETLSAKTEKINAAFQKHVEILVKQQPIKVMLGDTTVIDQSTFDPNAVSNFFSNIANKLSEWNNLGITTTTDEDLRRVFVKLEFQVKNYSILWHMALQYHALLFYKPDNTVATIQKELAEIMDNTINKEKELADLTDSMIKDKLESMGYKDIDEQKLFEVLFSNDALREDIATQTEKSTDFDFKAKDLRKKQLFRELDNLLLEAYTTTSVLIDENRLVTGEEGCLCTFDLDHLKNKKKEAIFDPKRISQDTRLQIIQALDNIVSVLTN